MSTSSFLYIMLLRNPAEPHASFSEAHRRRSFRALEVTIAAPSVEIFEHRRPLSSCTRCGRFDIGAHGGVHITRITLQRLAHHCTLDPAPTPTSFALGTARSLCIAHAAPRCPEALSPARSCGHGLSQPRNLGANTSTTARSCPR